jgi:hypothetical protein
VPLQLGFGKSLCKGCLGVNVSVTGQAYRHQVIEVIAAALASLDNVMHLELNRLEAAAQAAAPPGTNKDG